MCFTNSLHHLQWAASAVLGQEVACSPAWRGLARSKQGYASQYANRGCNTTLLRKSFLNGRESPSTALFFAVLLAPTTAKQVVIRKSALGFCFFLSEKKWNYSFHSLNLLLPFFFFFMFACTQEYFMLSLVCCVSVNVLQQQCSLIGQRSHYLVQYLSILTVAFPPLNPRSKN